MNYRLSGDYMEYKSPLMTKDTLLYIAEFLPADQLLELRLVCREWKRFIDHGYWKWEVIQQYGGVKYWPIQLQKLPQFKRYVSITQLGQFWQPGECFLVLITEDNRIELKHISAKGESKSIYTSAPQAAPITVVAPLRAGLFMTGDQKGSVAVWNTSEPKEMRRFQAHENSVSALFELSKKELMTGSVDGKITCWELFESDQKQKWSVNEKLPVQTIQHKNNEIQVVLTDKASKTFSVKYFALKDGLEKQPVSLVKFGVNASMHPLSQVMFFKNRFLTELRVPKDAMNQQVYVCNNQWNSEEKLFKPKTSRFKLEQKTDSWQQGHQTYVMSNGNFLFQCHGDGSAMIGIPKRLPLTRAEEFSVSEIKLNK